MTDGPVPPGWYPYPGGDGSPRWWDGVRWHEPEPPVVQQPLPAGVTTNTWAFWGVAALPVLGVVQNVVVLATGIFTKAFAGSVVTRVYAGIGTGDGLPVRSFVLSSGYTAFTALSSLLSLVLIAASGVLALRDQRALRGRGVVRPFPWGWGFLNPVYVIGRSVVVRRRVHGSLAPLWMWVVLLAVSFVLSGVVVVSAFAAAFSSTGTLGS